MSSKLHPSVLFLSSDGTWAIGHVDELLILGSRNILERFWEDFPNVYDVKGEFLEEGKTITYLGRTLGRDKQGYYWHGDTKHADILLQEAGMSDCKPAETPFWTEVPPEVRDADSDLGAAAATQIRRNVARINYTAQDRIDLSIPANRLSRNMSSPKSVDEVS